MLKTLFSPQGKIGRRTYAVWGTLLFAIKYNFDRIFSALYLGSSDATFPAWFYPVIGSRNIDPVRLKICYLILLVTSLPFIWIGIVMTLKRLRDVGWPGWLTVLFFLPCVNLFLFFALSLTPSGEAKADPLRSRLLDRWLPKSKLGSAAVALALVIPLSLVFTLASVWLLGDYGFGIFVGDPFFIGLGSVLIYGHAAPRKLRECFAVALIAVVLLGALFLALAIEGVLCILMAAPIAIALALFGAFIGYILHMRGDKRVTTPAFFAVVLMVPSVTGWQHVTQPEPTEYSVTSEVVISAPAEKIWENVVSFSTLPEPTEWLFTHGIAYPVRAKIEGRGIGAIRRCEFTTGAFVEPIEVWDEPRLLRFGVTSQPEPMREWTPYRDIVAPHLKGYFASSRGQFLLTELANGKTKLSGTTWYKNALWPQSYWKPWSDFIIHEIHMRVLRHIADLSTSSSTGGL